MAQDANAHVRALNDRLRTTGSHGRILVTAGVVQRGSDFLAAALSAVADFDTFTPDNDPHGEHDFGAVEVSGARLFWKIDYYGPDLCDEHRCERVLTIMLAEEY